MEVTEPSTVQLRHFTKRSALICVIIDKESKHETHSHRYALLVDSRQSRSSTHLVDRDVARDGAEDELGRVVTVHVSDRVRVREDLPVELRHERRHDLQLQKHKCIHNGVATRVRRKPLNDRLSWFSLSQDTLAIAFLLVISDFAVRIAPARPHKVMLLQARSSSTLQRVAVRAAGHRAPSAACTASPLRFSAVRTAVAACAQASPLLGSGGNVAHFASSARERFASSYSRQKRVKDSEVTADAQALNVSRIAVIGGGNMAEAIITGVLSEELLPREKLIVSDPNPDIRKKYQGKNIATSDRNVSAVKDADVIIMAVKPQVLHDVMESFQDAMKPDALVISVVAGATIDAMQGVFGNEARIIRTMPNTPAMIGEGMTVWSQSSEVTEEQHELTKRILGAFGIEVFVDDENSLDMATALSGTGPAYFFLVAEAMIDTGVHMGFSRAVATKLVQQTMLGSALYMQASDVHPVVLRNQITSPGGTTAAAMYRAEKNGFRAVIADSIWAAYERCVELGSPTPVQRKRPRS